ncbi:MAG: ribonuclease H-like domain-containing protein [Candidatus Wolfebacteria bacterium]|nr:ribonuclease H-like domain-containing protein [Candidatus Wolfebacteria bacterium]
MSTSHLTDFSQKKKLVFDIETIGVDFASLDKISQEYLLKFAEDEEEKAQAKDQLSFSPLTGEIVAIGMLNPDTDNGKIYLKSEKNIGADKLEEGIDIEIGTEKQILEKFWEDAKHYNYFISFNGRGFDVPFLLIRSAILEIDPTKDLMSNRYLSSQKFGAHHIDLFDQLNFYGAVRRKFNLHFWTKAFGIKSPKEEGITGDDVGRLYKEGKILDIAKYNLGDLRATKQLYEKWEKYLNF